MFKIITHLLTFAIGAGVGVYWGVQHPSDAQRVHDVEQQRMEQAKQIGKAANQTINPSTPAAP